LCTAALSQMLIRLPCVSFKRRRPEWLLQIALYYSSSEPCISHALDKGGQSIPSVAGTPWIWPS